MASEMKEMEKTIQVSTNVLVVFITYYLGLQIWII